MSRDLVTGGVAGAGTPDAATERRLGRLRIWNVAVGLILAVQAVMIAVLTNSFSLPVTATFMNGPPGTTPRLHHLFDVQVGWGVFAFLAISAGALLIIASPPVFGWYKASQRRRRSARHRRRQASPPGVVYGIIATLFVF